MAKYTIDTTFILKDLNMLITMINNNTYKGDKYNNDCLLWKGGTNDKGYPQTKVGSKSYKVYRLVYQAYNPLDKIDNMPIHHKCGNRLCVNFQHLQKVTDYQNVAEMHQRLWYEKEIERLNAIIACTDYSDNNRQNGITTDNKIDERKM
jgi:hypothetical protein